MAKDKSAKNRILRGVETAAKKNNKKKDKKKGDGEKKAKSPLQTVKKEVKSGIKVGEEIAPEFLGPDAKPLPTLDPTRVKEMDDFLARAKEASMAAGTQSDEMAFAVDRMKSGLGGFTSPEEEAMRARALEGVNAQYNAGMRAAAGLNLGRNLRGGAAAGNFVPVMNQTIQQRRGLENDIMAQQVAERARRLTEFTKTVGDRDASLADRRNAAMATESGALTTDRDYTSTLDKFNAEQYNKEVTAKLAARGLGLGLIQDEKAKRDAENQYQSQLQYNKETFDKLLNFAS